MLDSYPLLVIGYKSSIRNSYMHMKSLVVFLIVLAFGIAYLAWLDSGCELTGAMTWGGKVCVEDLTK